MSDAVAAIVAQLPKLSPEERAELADAVLGSLEEEPSEEFNRELERRIAQLQNGEAVVFPAEEVFAASRRKRQAKS